MVVDSQPAVIYGCSGHHQSHDGSQLCKELADTAPAICRQCYETWNGIMVKCFIILCQYGGHCTVLRKKTTGCCAPWSSLWWVCRWKSGWTSVAFIKIRWDMGKPMEPFGWSAHIAGAQDLETKSTRYVSISFEVSDLQKSGITVVPVGKFWQSNLLWGYSGGTQSLFPTSIRHLPQPKVQYIDGWIEGTNMPSTSRFPYFVTL